MNAERTDDLQGWLAVAAAGPDSRDLEDSPDASFPVVWEPAPW